MRTDCLTIIEELVEAQFSIFKFSNNSQIVILFTKDMNMPVGAIRSMEIIEEMYIKGSSLNTLKEAMLEVLKKMNQSK